MPAEPRVHVRRESLWHTHRHTQAVETSEEVQGESKNGMRKSLPLLPTVTDFVSEKGKAVAVFNVELSKILVQRRRISYIGLR